jgi:hypothetical protein
MRNAVRNRRGDLFWINLELLELRSSRQAELTKAEMGHLQPSADRGASGALHEHRSCQSPVGSSVPLEHRRAAWEGRPWQLCTEQHGGTLMTGLRLGSGGPAASLIRAADSDSESASKPQSDGPEPPPGPRQPSGFPVWPACAFGCGLPERPGPSCPPGRRAAPAAPATADAC